MFDDSMRHRIRKRMELEHDLRKAIERQQLALVYQPILCLRTGNLAAVEALVRWSHPERGVIAPNEFIPIAEDTGLIMEIGNWVLRTACKTFMEWRKRYAGQAPCHVSVNLSRVQIALPELSDVIGRTIRETGMTPACLAMEVTETAIMQDVDFSVKTLRKIKELGVQLSMDDFGTGYSSLACLHDLPLDQIKIDRAFITGLERGRDFAAMLHAITDLARNLEMSIVAEGLENKNQLALVQSLDCDFGQGYLFSPPMPPDKAMQWVRSGSHADDTDLMVAAGDAGFTSRAGAT